MTVVSLATLVVATVLICFFFTVEDTLSSGTIEIRFVVGMVLLSVKIRTVSVGIVAFRAIVLVTVGQPDEVLAANEVVVKETLKNSTITSKMCCFASTEIRYFVNDENVQLCKSIYQ